jgi:type II secretory pathway pseudopilin PulG
MEAQRRAFTFTELLVVLATITILSALLAHPLSLRRARAEVAACANNLRQLAVGTLLYADDNKGGLPPFQDGEPNMNRVSLCNNDTTILFHYGLAGTKVERSFDQPGLFENAGYLFPLGYAGDGGIYFCPALKQGPYSASFHRPLLTTSPREQVRSSYLFNHQTLAEDPQTVQVRRYVKLAEISGHKLLGGDVLEAGVPRKWAHKSSGGWNVLFSDGAVNFRRSAKLEQLLADGLQDRSETLTALFAELERSGP